jgi:Pregnancy-associated plasma protein-A/Secretion system C-terminal sorting domain
VLPFFHNLESFNFPLPLIFLVMRNFYLLLLLLLFYSQINAQAFPVIDEVPTKRCATYEVLEGFRRLHPEIESTDHFETWLRGKIASARLFGTESTVTLPIIFHIIHNNETVGTGTNLNASVIQQQVMQLNKDYANLSHSPYGVSADMEIQFALAQKDPGGATLAEPGIDRVNRIAAGFSVPPYTVGYANPANDYLTTTVKPNTIWDPARYINIWILDMESGILGISTFPSSSGLSGLNNSETVNTAGVAVAPFSVGSVYAPNSCGNVYGKGKTLTHELGHFFGLRHIWGDGTCATDFCNDTPVHEAANSGQPTHPKPNNCGTPDEMFENYMDYTDDAVLNTFTADQKTRMQTVLINSPFRNTLATSTVGLVPPPAGNHIAFAICNGTTTITETGTTGTYPRYKDLSVIINVENKATGAATLTINPGGTAINNFHYQLLTPSVVFANGDDSKVVTVRIFDNAQVDGSRTLSLGYSIAGSGVVAGPSAQTLTITITDDDNITVGNVPTTLLSQNFEGSVAGWSVFKSTGMPNSWVASNMGDAGGSGNCAYISNSTSTPFANTYTKTTAGAAVLRTPLINATGVSDMHLTFKYKIWGEDDGTQSYDRGIAMYATAAASSSFVQISAPGTGPYAGTTSIISGAPVINMPNGTFANNSFYLAFYWENDDFGGDDPAFNIDDIVLTGTTVGTGVENAVSSSYGFDVRSASATHHFRSTNNKIIADINNPNANLSGITVSVTQAGTSTTAVTTSVGSYFRTNKVIQITPAVANTTVTYQATLYFTTAELATWGASIPNLKILKVKDGTNLAGVLNSSNSELITPVFSDQSSLGYYTYTGNFTGFSQFMLVTPTLILPVELISFDAKAVRHSIALNWSTSQELNNKGFAIERSTNGVTFEKIGWLDGHINSSTRIDYAYTDNYVQTGIIYYYRLRQTDIDLKEKLSVTRQARIDDGGVVLAVSPNPAKDQLKLFISGSARAADVDLVNMQGQVVRRWRQVNASSAPLPLDISGLAAGLYMLQVQLPESRLAEKIILQ